VREPADLTYSANCVIFHLENLKNCSTIGVGMIYYDLLEKYVQNLVGRDYPTRRTCRGGKGFTFNGPGVGDESEGLDAFRKVFHD
jgi:hypothetical protein